MYKASAASRGRGRQMLTKCGVAPCIKEKKNMAAVCRSLLLHTIHCSVRTQALRTGEKLYGGWKLDRRLLQRLSAIREKERNSIRRERSARRDGGDKSTLYRGLLDKCNNTEAYPGEH